VSASLDAVVVGSGLGGLTAAALLARAGQRVHVFERHTLPGGYATTFQRDRGRVVFDVSLHGIGGLAGNGLVRKNLELCGAWERLNPIAAPNQYRTIFPQHDVRVPQLDVPGYVDALAAHFPEDRDGLTRLAREIADTHDEYERLQATAFKDLFRNPRAYGRVVKYSRCTQQALLDAFLVDPRLKALFAAQWSYHGAPPSKVPAIAFVISWAEYMHGGAFYLEGGSQALVTALVDVIREHGGEVSTRTPVRRILVDGGRATGVELGDGRRIAAGRVIANASPAHIVGELLEPAHVPAEWRAKVEALRPSLGTFLTFLALDRDVREISDLHDYNVVMTPSYDLDEVYARSAAGDVDNAELTIVVHSNLGPAATGREGGQIALFALSGWDRWARMERGEYRAAKVSAMEGMIDRLDRLIPGVRRHITVMDAATPLTNVRYTGNTHGSIYGFEKDLAQSPKMRTMSKTPVPGLFLSSAWAFPGGGYSGAIWAGYFCVHENDLAA
jgi:phytoene dehydrogenase-like protein